MTPRLYLLACICFLCLVAAKYRAGTGFTSLIRFGDQFHERALPVVRQLPVKVFAHTAGYDGQFYAQVALDPWLRSREIGPALDNPAYRARRILLPAVAAVLGLGNPWRTLQVYALLNVACWLWLGWLVRDIVGRQGAVSAARWLGCMFSVGVMDSVLLSLVDLPALVLSVFAIRQITRNREGASAWWFALATLARETSILGAASALFKPRRPFRSLLLVLLIGLPLAGWIVYVLSRFSAPDSAGWGNFTWPLLGMVGQAVLSVREIVSGQGGTRHFFALAAIAGFWVQAAVLLIHRRPENPWWRLGLASAFLLLFLGPQVWFGYWAACRAVLPLTIAFNLLLPDDRRFWTLWAAGNLTLLHAVWRFL